MKTKHITSLILAVACIALLSGCAGGQSNFSPKDAQGYANAAHTVIGNGLSDYKQVKQIQRVK